MKRTIAAVLMTSTLAACTSWRVQELTPQKAGELRITLADGRRLVLHHPEVRGDSLVELSMQGPEGSLQGYSQPVRVAVRTADLHRIEGKKVDANKTVLAVVGLGIVIGLGVALSNIQTTDPNH